MVSAQSNSTASAIQDGRQTIEADPVWRSAVVVGGIKNAVNAWLALLRNAEMESAENRKPLKAVLSGVDAFCNTVKKEPGITDEQIHLLVARCYYEAGNAIRDYYVRMRSKYVASFKTTDDRFRAFVSNAEFTMELYCKYFDLCEKRWDEYPEIKEYGRIQGKNACVVLLNSSAEFKDTMSLSKKHLLNNEGKKVIYAYAEIISRFVTKIDPDFELPSRLIEPDESDKSAWSLQGIKRFFGGAARRV